MNCVSVPVPITESSSASVVPGKKIAISTMGCKVNAFESELIFDQLDKDGYQRTREVSDADVFIINTCTVTAEADRQARQQVRKAIRRNPHARVVVTGCYAQIDPEACAAIPGVDLVVGNSKKLDIPKLLEPMYAQALPRIMVDDIGREISLPSQPVSGFEGRTRAFVQIQQGCDQGCTFCIIHTARGPNRSFSPAMVKRQVQRLVMNGYCEIVVCGVDIGSWGSDFVSNHGSGEPGQLAELLADLVNIDGDFRLRLSSVDPVHITNSLIEIMSASSKICPQLHLSMQSGNTLILKRMKRRATRDVLYERIISLKKAVPDLVLSADIMVGFPTETDQHFTETLMAVEDLGVAFPHVFRYSSRPGTPAARIPRQVQSEIKKSRAEAVRAAGKKVWQRIGSDLVGTSQRILPEGKSTESGLLKGRAANYFEVILEPDENFSKQSIEGWQEVEITGINDHFLIARRQP